MPTVENQLILSLPPAERKRFLSRCEVVPLTVGKVLCQPGSITRHVYFPIDGFISLLALVDETRAIEVGLVGREGMLGAQVALGLAATPLQALVQGRGSAWRISAAAFKSELRRSPPLQRRLNRYLYVLMTQLGASAACLRYHVIGPRLARWLLMTQDRSFSDSFPVTHEFLAYMLGVRRGGVTVAAGALQRAGLIKYHHGELQVLNRAGLESVACSCYQADRQTYTDILTSPQRAFS